MQRITTSKLRCAPIHYSNPYARNDIPTFLKQLFPKPNNAKAGSNYQEAKHTQTKFSLTHEDREPNPRGGGVARHLKSGR